MFDPLVARRGPGRVSALGDRVCTSLPLRRCRWRSSLCGALVSAALLATGHGAAFAQAPTSPSAAAAEYRLGGGDTIRVLVYQSPDLTLELRLSDGGIVSYPLLGSLKLGGLTVAETEQLIAQGLKKGDLVKNPQVTVQVLQVRGNQVSVLGQVGRPGRYPLELAQTRLSDVLAQAGGVLPASGADNVSVIGARNGKPFRLLADLPALFGAEAGATDIVLQNNDVIWVDRAPQVYIYGEVQKAGAMRLERGMTLMQGLAAGGGLTARGTEKGIRVHRRSATGRTEVLQPSMDEPLRDGDVVYVRESLF